jgi:hypothetical protein
MLKLPVDDEAWHTLHGRRDIAEQALLFVCRQQAEEISRLGIVIIASAMIVAKGIAINL